MSNTNETNTNANAETVKGAALPKEGATTVSTPVADKKSVKANAIFKEMFAQSPVPARKDMIARVVAEAGLTEKGAATYLQNYKKANGLVKTVAPAASA